MCGMYGRACVMCGMSDAVTGTHALVLGEAPLRLAPLCHPLACATAAGEQTRW